MCVRSNALDGTNAMCPVHHVSFAARTVFSPDRASRPYPRCQVAKKEAVITVGETGVGWGKFWLGQWPLSAKRIAR